MEQKGELWISDIWQNWSDSVHNMCVVNTDSKSFLAKTPEMFLQEAVRAQKKMYMYSCLQQRCHFSLFVASIDGLLYVEAVATLKKIASRLAKKLQQLYLRTCGRVNGIFTITLVSATNRCIRGPGCHHIGSVCNSCSEGGATLRMSRRSKG